LPLLALHGHGARSSCFIPPVKVGKMKMVEEGEEEDLWGRSVVDGELEVAVGL